MSNNRSYAFPRKRGKIGKKAMPVTVTEELQTKRHGGPGRGQGRKPVKEGEQTISTTLRMTRHQRDKLGRLGGAGWVRDRIDEAPEPTETSGE